MESFENHGRHALKRAYLTRLYGDIALKFRHNAFTACKLLQKHMSNFILLSINVVDG